MRYGPIENGVVTNAVIADASFAASQGWIAIPDGVGIGWKYSGGKFTAPGAVPPTKEMIPVTLVRQRIEKLGMLDDFGSYLFTKPGQLLKLQTLDGGLLDPDYPDIIAAFDSMNISPEQRTYILAPPSVGVPDNVPQ